MIARTNATSPKPYKRLLIQAKNLQATAKANVHKRVTLLVQVFDNQQFRIDHGADDFVLAGILDQYVSDIGWGFMELRSILEHFPNEKDWKESRLTKMHDEVVKQRRKQAATEKQSEAPVRRKPRRVTNADFEAVKNENRELRAKYREAASRGLDRQDAAMPEGSNGKQESEVVRLRRELAVAKKRIASLEKENAELRTQLQKYQQATP